MSEVIVTPVVPGPPSLGPGATLEVPSTKGLIGVIAVLALLSLVIAWISLSVKGLAGWINIILMITAVLLIVIIGWLFFSA